MSPDREPLTYEPATEQERAEVRERVRRRLAEAAERHDEDYYQRLRDRFGVTHRAA